MNDNNGFMNDPEMKAALEQISRDIEKDIEAHKIAFKGNDGKDYYSIEDLQRANKEWFTRMHPFIGRDGREYSTIEELHQADQKYMETMYAFKGKDGREYSTMEEVERADRRYFDSQMPVRKDDMFFVPRDEKIYSSPFEDTGRRVR